MNNPSSEEFLVQENRQLRKAGCKLAEAALYVAREYDGVHRLMLAVSEWSKTVADEGGRGKSPICGAANEKRELFLCTKQGRSGMSKERADRLKAKAAAEDTRNNPDQHIRDDWELDPPTCDECGDVAQATAYNDCGSWYWDWDCECGELIESGLPSGDHAIEWPFKSQYAYKAHWEAAGGCVSHNYLPPPFIPIKKG